MQSRDCRAAFASRTVIAVTRHGRRRRAPSSEINSQHRAAGLSQQCAPSSGRSWSTDGGTSTGSDPGSIAGESTECRGPRRSVMSSGERAARQPAHRHLGRDPRRDRPHPPGGRPRFHRAGARRVRHRQGSRRARHPRPSARAASGPSSRSTAARFPQTCSRASFSATRKASFTGAVATRKGRFEIAEGGTLFLDEIGDMSPTMQVKLLRVLQERVFERVGNHVSIRCNVRIIAATHRNLEESIARRHLPRRPLPSPERIPHRDAGAARASRRPAAAGARFHRAQHCRRARPRAALAARIRGARRLSLAGQRARACEPHRAAVDRLQRPHRRHRRSAREIPARRLDAAIAPHLALAKSISTRPGRRDALPSPMELWHAQPQTTMAPAEAARG